MPKLRLPVVPAFGGNLKQVAAVGIGLLIVLIAGFAIWRMGARQAQLEVRIEWEAADSTRYAATIELVRSLQARQDTIQQKIEVIRSVDTRRYVWPHLMSEISLALPEYTWLSEVTSGEPADSLSTGPHFTIQGNAGSTPALTRFMKNLESSPYVHGVNLITTEQEVVEGRTIQRFSLEASYGPADVGAIEAIPILGLE